MTTLFGTPETRVSSTPSGVTVLLYAFAGMTWLVMAVADFRRGHHTDRAWIHVVTGLLYLFSTVLHLSRWKKDRSVS